MTAGDDVTIAGVAGALDLLQRAGFSLVSPQPPAWRALTVAEAAERLACSEDWVRENLREFRGAFRLGSAIRVPAADVEAVARRRRIFDLEGRQS
jgi:excisionase family DNA binding protein